MLNQVQHDMEKENLVLTKGNMSQTFQPLLCDFSKYPLNLDGSNDTMTQERDFLSKPFRDKSLTGFAEKGIVFIPAASSGAF
jgi:hypothetical protein